VQLVICNIKLGIFPEQGLRVPHIHWDLRFDPSPTYVYLNYFKAPKNKGTEPDVNAITRNFCNHSRKYVLE
jgi:hypothetical protein